MLKWRPTNSHPSLQDFFQLPVATWDSSQFPDSVSNQLLKDAVAVSRPSDLFQPSPKQVLKFSHFKPYLLSQQLPCRDWLFPALVDIYRGLCGTPSSQGEEPTLLPYCCTLSSPHTANKVFNNASRYSFLKIRTGKHIACELFAAQYMLILHIWMMLSFANLISNENSCFSSPRPMSVIPTWGG